MELEEKRRLELLEQEKKRADTDAYYSSETYIVKAT